MDFIHKEPKPKHGEGERRYKKRWITKWLHRFHRRKWAGHLLTPDSVPYYMARYVIDDTGKKQYGSFRTYLDGAVFNIAGIPKCESIIQYAKRKKLPSLELLKYLKRYFKFHAKEGDKVPYVPFAW